MLGVDFVTGVRVGRDLSVDELTDDGFDAVYLATGAGIDRELRIPGAAEFDGVSMATEFLRRANAATGKRCLPLPRQGWPSRGGRMRRRSS